MKIDIDKVHDTKKVTTYTKIVIFSFYVFILALRHEKYTTQDQFL